MPQRAHQRRFRLSDPPTLRRALKQLSTGYIRIAFEKGERSRGIGLDQPPQIRRMIRNSLQKRLSLRKFRQARLEALTHAVINRLLDKRRQFPGGLFRIAEFRHRIDPRCER